MSHPVALVVQEGVATIAAVSASTDNGNAGEEGGGGLMGHPSIARLGFALQVVIQATRGGEGVCCGCLAPTIASLLPNLLRVQVLPPLLSVECPSHCIVSAN